MDLKTLIFLGPSGSGKGTQVARIKEYLETHDSERNVVELVMGGLFRSFWKGEGYVEDLSRDINLSGELQPSFLQINLWSNFLLQNLKGNEHLIIDGSPRRLTDLDAMESAFEFFKRPHPTLVHIDISPECAKERLLARAATAEKPRPEDVDPTLIEKRLAWYRDFVLPVVDAMKKKPAFTVLEIDGEQSRDDVYNDMMQQLGLI